MSNISNENSGLPSSMIYLLSKTTKKRQISSDYSDIIYYFYSSIICPHGFVFLISLHDRTIPVTWDLISAYNENNTLVYSINGVTTTYTIPDGNYSVLDLQDLFNTNTPFTVSYSTVTNEYTFTHATYDFILISSSTCFDIIGLTDGASYSSTSKSLTCVNGVDLSGTREMYICTNIRTLTLDSRIGTANSSILAKVPINVSNGNILTYNNLNGFRNVSMNNIINNIHVRIEDDNGNLLTVNKHYSMSIELHITPNKLMIYSNMLPPNEKIPSGKN